MAGKNPLHPIPHPARKPIVGNLLSIGSDSPVLDMWKIAQDLGGIYWLDMPGMPVVVISDHELVNELVDEKRFDKSTNGALRRLRAASHGKVNLLFPMLSSMSEIQQTLASYRSYEVEVRGYADATGSRATNYRTSKDRADYVYYRLIGLGAVPLYAFGMGPTNRFGTGRENRIVQIRLTRR